MDIGLRGGIVSHTIHPDADDPGLVHRQWCQSQTYTIISFSCFLGCSFLFTLQV